MGASIYDVRHRLVDDRVCVLVLAGLITIAASFGGACGRAAFYLGAGLGKNGAGDTVLAASAGFVLGLSRTLAGLTLFAFCYALFVLGKSLVLKLSHRPTRFTCPLVPFIAAGFIPAYFL
ncbi:MAG: hypothetical protein ACLRJV_18795 [Eubacteriales bacterium]